MGGMRYRTVASGSKGDSFGRDVKALLRDGNPPKGGREKFQIYFPSSDESCPYTFTLEVGEGDETGDRLEER
jgi:hypothetical protein